MDQQTKQLTQSEIDFFERKLQALQANGADCMDPARILIERNNLPFIIVSNPDGSWRYQSQFSAGELWLQKFVTVDPETIQMKEDALKMSKTPYEVLVFGETGTGKELIAKSQINNRPGVIKAANCAGFPSELVESELFGYVSGAFTGAGKTTDGLIKAATGGVMFLDEVGELPMWVQAKLLRVIQEKTVRKVGGKEIEPVDCKFVFATNRDLKAMVKAGTFREDLYARISTLELTVNPLRERKCDIEPIVLSLPGGDKFWDKYRSMVDSFDLSLNVRSLQRMVIRYNTLGRI